MLVGVFLPGLAHETAGAARTRSSLRPRYFEGHGTSHQLGARVACEGKDAFVRALRLAPLAGRGRNLREARISGEGVQVCRLAPSAWREPLTPTLSPRRAGRGRRGSGARLRSSVTRAELLFRQLRNPRTISSLAAGRSTAS